MFREKLECSLNEEADFQVVGQCASTAKALLALRRAKLMVLLDAHPGGKRAAIQRAS